MKISSGHQDVQESESSMLAKKYYEESRAAMSTLLTMIDEIVSNASREISDNHLTKGLANFLALKQSQRNLAVLVGSELQEQLTNSKRQVEEKSLNFQNLLYEKNHLDSEIESMKQFDSPYLVKMARQEILDGTVDLGGDVLEENNSDEIIDSFLKPLKAHDSYSHRDVSYHNSNLSKIYGETTGRGQLQNELNAKLKEMEDVKRSYDEKVRFLIDIPSEVQKLEQACLFMQNHMKGFYENFDGDNDLQILQQSLIDRGDMLNKALQLPKYLYAMYVQFLAILDSSENVGDTSYHGWKLNVVDTQLESGFDIGDSEADAKFEKILKKSNKSLQLSIPLPDAQSRITDMKVIFNIYFDYFSELNIVSTRCETIGDTIESVFWSGQDILVNLFQDDDDGRDLPLGITSRFIFESSENVLVEQAASKYDIDSDTEFDSNERPEVMLGPDESVILLIRESLKLGTSNVRVFDWCQSLCGLQYPKSKSPYHMSDKVLKSAHLNVTTRGFLKQVQRRIRSHSKLQEISKLLSVCPLKLGDLPCHSSLNLPVEKFITTQVTGFKIADKSVSPETTGAKSYVITLERGGARIKAEVKIKYAYPAIPPLFFLQESTETPPFEGCSKRPKLAIEQALEISEEPLYDESLGQIESTLNSLEDASLFFNKKVEESYDMILVHQIHFFVREWDQLQLQS